MDNVKVQLVKLGEVNVWLDLGKITRWKSNLFQVLPKIDQHRLPARAEGYMWEYLDTQVSCALPERLDGDFLLAITDCPLEDNFYMRRLPNNRVCITLFQVRDILSRENIPVENFILKCLYEVLVLYTLSINNDGQLPKSEESYTHDETKGCLFDMTGNKDDLATSCRAPILCDTCYADFSRNRVPTNLLDNIRLELKNIRKPMYYRIVSIVKRHPIISLVITGIAAILLNIISILIMRLF